LKKCTVKGYKTYLLFLNSIFHKVNSKFLLDYWTAIKAFLYKDTEKQIFSQPEFMMKTDCNQTFIVNPSKLRFRIVQLNIGKGLYTLDIFVHNILIKRKKRYCDKKTFFIQYFFPVCIENIYSWTNKYAY